MSLFSEYTLERTDNLILEQDNAFATYRHIPDQKTTYIIDIFVQKEFRKTGLASSLADQIAKEAKILGHSKLLGSIVPSAKGSTASLDILRAYGFRLQSAGNDYILMEKGI